MVRHRENRHLPVNKTTTSDIRKAEPPAGLIA
jgi:hypothetical protein